MRIPTKFKLVNKVYTVEAMDQDVYEIGGCVGAHSQGSQRILIYLDDEDNHPTYIIQTFLHELFHAMFEAAGHDKLSEDEALVDDMAAVLHQFIQTNRGDLQKSHTEDT